MSNNFFIDHIPNKAKYYEKSSVLIFPRKHMMIL